MSNVKIELMRAMFAFLVCVLILLGCQADSKNEEIIASNLQTDKFYSVTRSADNKILTGFIKDKNLQFDLEAKYYYNSNDSLEKQVLRRIFQDSVVIDSVIYSFFDYGSEKKFVMKSYENGDLNSERVFERKFQNDYLTEKDFMDISYNTFTQQMDTIFSNSVYHYLNDQLSKKTVYGKYLNISYNFIYENELLSKRVLIEEQKKDTVSILEYFYMDTIVFKTTERDYIEESLLSSYYNADGILLKAFWENINGDYDTVKVDLVESENKMEYYWDKDFYPLFTLEIKND